MEVFIMVVQHNISSMNANRYYGINNSGLSKSLEKLSSGYAINRAGDNAAGLAVSEKMRSQINGLTQGVKNAEDGISMIQTYEGALTETDSILQRMKTLATQSANGTYQDDVDRDAIQLEFDQLNDELDQIADTDYNGVVALNGGVMADGTKAVDGKFDYGVRDAKQLSSKDINRIDYQLFDDTDTDKGLTKADTVWNKLNENWDRSADGTDTGPDSVDVTFQYDATKKEWSCIGATNGADYEAIDTITNTTNGGFSFKTGNVDIANVVLNQTDLQNGDTITLTLNNPYAAKTAPTNIGAEMTDASSYKEGSHDDAYSVNDINLKVELGNYATDDNMSEDINKIFDALDGATVNVNFAKTTAAAAGDTTITFSDGQTYTGNTTAQKITLTDDPTVSFYAKTDAKGVTTISTDQAGSNKLATLTATVAKSADDDSSGTVSYKIAVENNQYDTQASPSVTVKEPEAAGVSESNAYSQATAPLTYTDNITLQTGARSKDAVNFTFKYSSGGLGDLQANMNCSSRDDGLGTGSLDLTTQESANAAIDKIDNAINKVSMVRATFGATQNRLEHKIDNMNVTNENITSAESRIRDTDMATEMTNFTKNQILAQASQAMLAQANQLPQGVLQLLG
jgi:flagellin